MYAAKRPKRINSFSITVLAIFVVLGYLAWFYIPAWWPIFRMSNIMRGACTAAFHNHDDKKLVQGVITDGRIAGLTLSEDNFIFERVPFEEEELVALGAGRSQYEARGRECRFQFYYEDTYLMPIFNRPVKMTWEREVVRSLAEED